ncbi:unnamed protein product [Rhizophagus irregularis]|nr:unnamed protein product [Rhizophagus irregularis]
MRLNYIVDGHDENLAIKICCGLRPRFNIKTHRNYHMTSFESSSYNTHSEASYTSRLLDFNNLPEPKNSDDYYEQNDNIISKEYSESLQLNLSQLNINTSESLQINISQLNINVNESLQINISQLNINENESCQINISQLNINKNESSQINISRLNDNEDSQNSESGSKEKIFS